MPRVSSIGIDQDVEQRHTHTQKLTAARCVLRVVTNEPWHLQEESPDHQ